MFLKSRQRVKRQFRQQHSFRIKSRTHDKEEAGSRMGTVKRIKEAAQYTNVPPPPFSILFYSAVDANAQVAVGNSGKNMDRFGAPIEPAPSKDVFQLSSLLCSSPR